MMSSHTRSLKRWTALLGTTLCLLLSAMIYLIWSDGKATGKTSLTVVDAFNIRIQRDGFDDIQLKKTKDRWQIESPCKLMANEQRLTPLMGALKPSPHQYSAIEVDLEAAGLVKPEAIVFINEVEHRLGNTDLQGDRRYVQRGNRVEFAPEWVLSLVNGGVTALAKLEVFTEPLNRLLIKYDSSNTRQIPVSDELTMWQNLTAQQISIWPLPGVESVMDYELQAVDTSGSESTYFVYNNDDLTAIRLDGAACAYILSTDALPK